MSAGARPLPAPLRLGMIGLVAIAILSALAVRQGLAPVVADPVADRRAAGVAAVASRDLLFADRADGAVVVREASGGEIAVVAPGSDQGFIRGVMRGLARDRQMRGLGPEAPFRLTLWADQSLSLVDLATGRSIELGAFGPTNRAAFEALLERDR